MAAASAVGLCAGATLLSGATAQAATSYPVTATIPVGNAPSGVAVDPSTHSVYVTNGNGVSVIDGDVHTGTVTATIPVVGGARGVAVDPSNHNVCVTNGNGVSVIDESGDAHAGTVAATTPVAGGAGDVAVDPSNHHVYAITGDSVSVISPRHPHQRPSHRPRPPGKN